MVSIDMVNSTISCFMDSVVEVLRLLTVEDVNCYPAESCITSAFR